MKKIIFLLITIFIASFTACEAEDSSISPLAGWWQIIRITTAIPGSPDEIENFPSTGTEDKDGDGLDESITFIGFLNITQNGDIMNQKIYMQVIGIIDPVPLCNCLPPVNYVGHCTEVDGAFTIDGGNLIYTEDSPFSGTAPYTLENNSLTITAQNGDGNNEKWELSKLGSAPINPENANNQTCDN